MKTCHSVALLALLAAGLRPPLPARAQEIAGPEYVVQSGDTLYAIAGRFGTTVEALVQANSIGDAAAIAVGQRLVIPGYEGLGGLLTARELTPGETLDSLALRQGVSRATLARFSRVLNPARMFVGQPMVFPDGGDGSVAAATGRVLAARAGETLLGAAAAAGASPWALRLLNALPGAWLPGQPLVVPGGDRPLIALPEPATGLRLAPLPMVQGRALAIRLRLTGAAQVSGRLGEYELHFNVQGEEQVALQGMGALAEPGPYLLQLSIRAPGHADIQFEQWLPLQAGGYGYDPPLVVDPGVIDPAVVNPEYEQVLGIVRPVTPTRYWEGLFQPPSSGRVVSFFGSRRSYNGGPYDSFHSGADYFSGVGAPILAPAPGVVVFAGPLVVRGNATIIDHGWGVYSGYWHQSEIQVAAGQAVQAGEQIGLVGGTGRVTGPHLHWEIWVGGVPVDPVQWIEVAFP